MTTNTPMQLIRDINSFVCNADDGVPFSGNNIRFVIEDNTVVDVTIPATLESNMYTAVMKFAAVGGPEVACVWVQPTGDPTLTLPSSTPSATYSQLNPGIRNVVPGQELQFICGNDFETVTEVHVSIELYANPMPR